MKYLILVICLVLAAVVGKGVFFALSSPGQPENKWVYMVKEGASFNQVASELYKKKPYLE